MTPEVPGERPPGKILTPDEMVAFVRDCAAHGVKAVSLGGGEPLPGNRHIAKAVDDPFLTAEESGVSL